MQTIQAAALVLEPQVVTHAEEMWIVLSDPAIYEFENGPPASLDWLRARYARLEARLSPDGQQQWLNWVIRLPTSELIGYVQATIYPDRRVFVAYELSSAYWGRGLATQSVTAMMAHLTEYDQINDYFAILKRDNVRSYRLLERLGFVLASVDQRSEYGLESDELLMCCIKK